MLLKAMLAYLRIQLFFPPLTTRKIILNKNSYHDFLVIMTFDYKAL